jgi:hypothetical protein
MFLVRPLMFLIRSLMGMSWLLVSIAGLGRRASIVTRGGTPDDVGDGGRLDDELILPKKLDFLPAAKLGAFSRNWCCLRAYASPSAFSVRGGSMGRNVKFAMALGFSLKNDGRLTVTFT